MSLRSIIVTVGILIGGVSLLSGCSGGGSTGEPLSPSGPQGGGSTGAPVLGGTAGGGTQTAGGTVTSGDGNAQLVVPSGVGVAASSITLQPAAPTPADPDLVAGAVYSMSDGTPPLEDAVGQPMALTLKFDPKKLPAGTTPGQLGIASPSPLATFKGWIAVTQGVVVNSSADTVTVPIRSPQTYAVFAANPFAVGNVHGQSLPLKCQFTGSASGTLNLAIDPSGSLLAKLSGSATPDYGNGSVTLAGVVSFTIVMGTTPGSTTFSGTLTKTKGVITGSGTWAGANNSSGSWTIS